MEGRVRPLDREAVRGILQRGGTILGTSRRDPYVHGEGAASVTRDARAGAPRRARRRRRRRDAPQRASPRRRRASRSSGCRRRSTTTSRGTDATFGFDTAVQIATEAIDRITTTAESHDRVMVVEVMGRTCGWIATYAGIAAGADAILVPEEPYDLDAVADLVRAPGRARAPLLGGGRGRGDRAAAGARAVAAPLDAFGFERLGGVAAVVAAELERSDGVRGAGHGARARPARRHADCGGPRPRLALRRRRGRPRRRRGPSGGWSRSAGSTSSDVPLEVVRGDPRSVPAAILDVARALSTP